MELSWDLRVRIAEYWETPRSLDRLRVPLSNLCVGMNFQNKSVTSAVLRLRYRLVSPADYWVQSRQRIFLATAHLTWSCGVCFSLKQEEALKAEETVRRATQRHGTIRILSRPNASNSTHLQLNLEIILSIWRPKVHAEKKDRNRFLLEHGPHFVGFAWGRSTCGQRHLCPPWKAILSQK